MTSDLLESLWWVIGFSLSLLLLLLLGIIIAVIWVRRSGATPRRQPSEEERPYITSDSRDSSMQNTPRWVGHNSREHCVPRSELFAARATCRMHDTGFDMT
ncbi:hypothetical protein DQ04_04511040 [Trypanosoma grayi]|uniref:hypothetical protein n=1 Tax=Trypanosoma grayi TaxID=71804 RepID=UPI0004F41D2F|nr:hypothetical protein DQ04_04511040 [Trypanosoma grayi]KEG09872.1 hypothetical protein DQ04_04511040 [Trypanosoma grayi]